MTLAVQIVLGVAILGGLILPFIGNKGWHWSQFLLVICVLLAGTGFIVLAAETMRVHHVLRAKIPQMERDLENLARQNEELLRGAGDKQGVLDLQHQMRMLLRQRGRTWREVQPAGDVGPGGVVQIQIAQPSPHGLAKDTIVYAFEAGGPTEENPDKWPEYLGEFRVTEVSDGGATLESVMLLDERTSQRLAASQGPWNLYETMPQDDHEVYSAMEEEELRKILPADSVEEYLRHGTEATADDDQWHRAGFDENGKRLVGAEQEAQAVKWLYDRQLRDYAYLFSELARERVVLQANIQAAQEDNAKLIAANESGKRLGEYHEQQKAALARDKAGMDRDRVAIQQLNQQVSQQLAQAREAVQQYLALNSELAERLAKLQQGRLQAAPAASESDLGLLAP